jgi:hypothetical protein
VERVPERSNTFIDALSEIFRILDVGAINFLRKRYAYGSIVSGSGFIIGVAHIVRDLLGGNGL